MFDEGVPDLGWLLNDPQMAECLADPQVLRSTDARIHDHHEFVRLSGSPNPVRRPQALSVVNTVFKEPSAASAYKGTRMEPLALKVASMRRRP